VNPAKLPAKDLKELLVLLKAKPGEYNYASSGNGTIIHFAGAMFADQAGVDIRHVPYKGTGPMITDLLGGQVDLGAVALPAVQGHLKNGTRRAIGLCGKERPSAAPEIPTLSEQGLADYEVSGWFAVVGPPTLPAAEVKHVRDAFASAFAAPQVRAAMAKQGNDISIGTPDQAERFFRAEIARYTRLANKIGIQLD